MDLTTLIGFAAAIISLSSSLPQIAQIWKTKQTKDISLKMYVTLCVGISLWLVYGVLRDDIVLIVANAIALVLNLSILLSKTRYG